MKRCEKKKIKTVKEKDYKANSKKTKIASKVKESAIGYSLRETILVDNSWDFKKANTKEFTHCFHSYPAMMIPQVARRIIDLFTNKSTNLLFDPYCGTGTSLVEANLNGINAIGTDINPLARLIAKSKTTKLDIQVLDLFLHDFINFFFSINFQLDQIKSVVIPNVKNIDFWFAKNVQYKLGALLAYIEKINDREIKNFFKVAFSETVRETSFVKQGEFKLVKNKEIKSKDDVDVFGIMISKLSRNKLGLIEFLDRADSTSITSIYDFNTVNSIPSNIIKSEQVDIVLTSPPYGDSRTTVAYGQYSRMSNEWLGYSEANQIDNLLMGGKKRKHHHIFKSVILNDVISTIQQKDKERVRDVISFYEDYESSINNVASTIKPGGYACYVVGNRTVKGIKIPTDQITKELFVENDFNHIETFVRNIPNKRMPLKNSPSNIVGETASTMKNEFIVICRKN
jgi:tRNA G10  N-methylase Trm11